jgi:hypothetical protein
MNSVHINPPKDIVEEKISPIAKRWSKDSELIDKLTIIGICMKYEKNIHPQVLAQDLYIWLRTLQEDIIQKVYKEAYDCYEKNNYFIGYDESDLQEESFEDVLTQLMKLSINKDFEEVNSLLIQYIEDYHNSILNTLYETFFDFVEKEE